MSILEKIQSAISKPVETSKHYQVFLKVIDVCPVNSIQPGNFHLATTWHIFPSNMTQGIW